MYHNIYCIEDLGDSTGHKFASYTPEPSELPWTVALLLGSHSRKHVFENTHKLPSSVLAASLNCSTDVFVGNGTIVTAILATPNRWSSQLFRIAVSRSTTVSLTLVGQFAEPWPAT